MKDAEAQRAELIGMIDREPWGARAMTVKAMIYKRPIRQFASPNMLPEQRSFSIQRLISGG